MRPPALWEDNLDSNRVKIMIPVSLGIHVFIAVTSILVSIFAPRKLPPPIYQVTLVSPIRKGTPGGGAAPAATKSVVKVAATVAPAKTAPPDLTQPSKAETREETIARIKKEMALKKLAADAAKRNGETPPPEATPTKLAAANPVGTPGTASGEGKGNGGVEYGTWDGLPGSATYEQQIQAIVRKAWDPVLLDETEYQCVIRVFIDLDGTILQRNVEAGSGNRSFDMSGNTALIKIGKFPPPPPELKLYLLHKGIPMRFDSRDRAD